MANKYYLCRVACYEDSDELSTLAVPFDTIEQIKTYIQETELSLDDIVIIQGQKYTAEFVLELRPDEDYKTESIPREEKQNDTDSIPITIRNGTEQNQVTEN